MAPSRRKGASKAAAAAAAARRQWKVGDLVLAKVKGFPAWPATVSEPEKWGYAADLKKVLVYFFGTQQIAFCNPADIEAFTEEKKESLLVKRHGKGADFVRAVHEIIESYEKLKKEDQVNNCNFTDEQSLMNENNNTESLTKSFSKDEAPTKTSQFFRRKTYSSAAQGVNANPKDSAAVIEDDLRDIEMLSKEVSSGSMAAETGMVNTYLTRGSQAEKGSTQRRPPTRRTRRSSRIDANKLQSLMMTCGSYAKNAVSDGANALWEGSARRNKRLRKSPDIDRHDVDSPDLVSNCSIEGNDSEILTADSDSLSLNDGSTVESDCKTIQPESVNEFCQLDVHLSRRLDFQTNAVINKKKRKPSRKRPTNDATEFAVKSDEKIASDSDIAKIEHNMPSDNEKSTERYSRDDGDEHLPLVKRARVRMGRASSIGVPETSQDAEEKLPEGSNGISELLHGSSNKDGDGFMDQRSSLAKEDTNNSSPQNRCPATKPQLWEARKNQFGSSLDGEAALPPSKRLNRALEAMSANTAGDSQASSEEPSKMKPENIGYCSPSAGFSKLSMETNSSREFLVGEAEKNDNTAKDSSSSDYSAVPELPIPGGRISSADVAASTSFESPKQEHTLECSDGKHHLGSSCNIVSDTVVEVLSPNLLSPNHCKQDASINCNDGSQDLVMPPDDCNAGRLKLVKPSAKPDHEISHLDSTYVSGSNDSIHSPNNATIMCMDCADDRGNETTKSCQLLQVENQDPAMFRGTVETGQIERGSSTSSSVPMEVFNASHDNQNLHSDSASDGQSGDKAVSVTLSSSSLTDGLDSAARATPHTSTCNVSAPDNVSIQINGSCSPAVQSHSCVPRTAANWNSKDADSALASFETSLRTLTRTKESIGRATRVAIDCAKYGVAAKVVEILAHSLEHESSLPRRVDLFFLVDSISQCSKGLKGEVGGIYPSAILAVLPRLLSAAAPPGSSSQENRRQCLKVSDAASVRILDVLPPEVLRVWQERRILPESIIRHHIRELDSLCSSSCSRAFSRRPLRNERSFDDPIREMEGMLVDEYGSNSSIQLPGFCMPPMLRDEDDGIDSDGENFEAVTPEHNDENPEGERMQIPVVEKHRHILEDVDGELEMEDVAPSSEAVASTSNMMGTENQTFHHPPGNTAGGPFAPPLPQDVPPRSPPLPTSPPPPAPPTSFPLRYERLESTSNGLKSRVYSCPQLMEDSLQRSTQKQSIAPGVNSSVSDSIHYSSQDNDDFHPQGSKQVNSANSCSFSSPPVSNPAVRAVNNIPPADGAFNKGFRLRPPHPAPSNQFSYVQADQRVQSRRDIPPPSHPNRFHVPNAENGNFYRDCDRMKLAPLDIGERWRTPPFPGPRYPDGSGMHYAPTSYAGQLREPAFPNQRWNFQSRAMNHRELMQYRPPAGGPIPVAARGHNFWRPR